MGRLVVSPRAEAELDAIATFIARRDGELRATAVVERIWKTMNNLAFMPGMGRSDRSYLEEGARMFPSAPWIIIYELLPDGDGILVQRVLDGSRNLSAIFRSAKRRR